MYAYRDSKCVYGYMTICDECIKTKNVPNHVDILNPIKAPPTIGVKQDCELCKKKFVLKECLAGYLSAY